MSPVQISATPEACAALRRATQEHGPLMFHTSGGRVGGRQYPICLPVAALRLGARDHLLGEVEGIPVYEMEDRENGVACRAQAYVLDVAVGPAIGFSIGAAPGKRFTLMPVAENACSDHIKREKT